MEWDAVADDTDNNAFDNHRLLGQVDLNRLELLILGQQPDHGTFLPIALDGHFILDAGNNNLPQIGHGSL